VQPLTLGAAKVALSSPLTLFAMKLEFVTKGAEELMLLIPLPVFDSKTQFETLGEDESLHMPPPNPTAALLINVQLFTVGLPCRS
jgi:hypothetical protein